MLGKRGAPQVLVDGDEAARVAEALDVAHHLGAVEGGDEDGEVEGHLGAVGQRRLARLDARRARASVVQLRCRERNSSFIMRLMLPMPFTPKWPRKGSGVTKCRSKRCRRFCRRSTVSSIMTIS